MLLTATLARPGEKTAHGGAHDVTPGEASVLIMNPDSSNKWRAAGLPECIVTWLENPDPYNKGLRYRERAERFATYSSQSYENEKSLVRAWKQLENHAKDEGALITIFLTWPDKPDVQPFSAIYGRRTGKYEDPADEEDFYRDLSKKIGAVMSLLKPNELRKLLSDIPNNEDGRQSLNAYRNMNSMATKQGLAALRSLLDAADPKAKYLTQQVRSQGAAIKTYTILLAGLNRHLKKPMWAAINTIAAANCPDYLVTKEAIRKAAKNTDS